MRVRIQVEMNYEVGNDDVGPENFEKLHNAVHTRVLEAFTSIERDMELEPKGRDVDVHLTTYVGGPRGFW